MIRSSVTRWTNGAGYFLSYAHEHAARRDHWLGLARSSDRFDGLRNIYVDFARNAHHCRLKALKEAQRVST